MNAGWPIVGGPVGRALAGVVRAAFLPAGMALACVVAVGCVQSQFTDFGGDRRAAVPGEAELFRTIDEIDRPHEMIGRLVSEERLADRDAMVRAMRREAARRGADAMVLVSMERFAWSDLPGGPAATADDPLLMAVESKVRWRGDALLVRWLPDDPAESTKAAESVGNSDVDP